MSEGSAGLEGGILSEVEQQTVVLFSMIFLHLTVSMVVSHFVENTGLLLNVLGNIT